MKEKHTRKSATSETVKACASISLTAISAVAMGVLQATTITNYENKNVIGNKKVAPTDDKTSLESRESSGVSNDSSLSKDDVSAQKGEVDAAETEGKASTSEATASDCGASALKTKAGATDIATKGIKLN